MDSKFQRPDKSDPAGGAGGQVPEDTAGLVLEPQAAAAEALNRVFKLYKINTSAIRFKRMVFFLVV